MTVQECAEAGGRITGPSPDIAATAEVLRSLYLPGECRHLVELLLAAGSPASPPAASGAGSDAEFLDAVQGLLAAAPNPRAGGERLRALRDALQLRARFLDGLQDELRQCGEEAAPVLDREELAARLRRRQARASPRERRSLPGSRSRRSSRIDR